MRDHKLYSSYDIIYKMYYLAWDYFSYIIYIVGQIVKYKFDSYLLGMVFIAIGFSDSLEFSSSMNHF